MLDFIIIKYGLLENGFYFISLFSERFHFGYLLCCMLLVLLKIKENHLDILRKY